MRGGEASGPLSPGTAASSHKAGLGAQGGNIAPCYTFPGKVPTLPGRVIDQRGIESVSAVVSYKVVDVKPLYSVGGEPDEFPRRMLGRVLNAQDVVNLGGHFEGKDKVLFFHQGVSWVMTLEKAEEADEWNALPHGRDEGAYDTEIQLDRRLQRLFIP